MWSGAELKMPGGSCGALGLGYASPCKCFGCGRNKTKERVPNSAICLSKKTRSDVAKTNKGDEKGMDWGELGFVNVSKSSG